MVLLKYVPHGINTKFFFKPESELDKQRSAELRERIYGGEEVRFAVLYNNRNIRRKMTGDVILAYRKFLVSLPEEDQKYCRLLLHTQPIDENGTDLVTLIRDITPEIKPIFSTDRVDTATLNYIYSNIDVVINLASNEGFGLGTLEALLAEKMIIANVTGGLQDQMGFMDENGKYLHEDIHFNAKFGSNHEGRYKEHGEWAIPVFPNNLALIGSPPTPYIFDDRCDWREAADAIRKVYDMGPEERARRGAAGRHYALTEGFSAEEMCDRFMDGFEKTFESFKPRPRFVMVKA